MEHPEERSKTGIDHTILFGQHSVDHVQVNIRLVA